MSTEKSPSINNVKNSLHKYFEVSLLSNGPSKLELSWSCHEMGSKYNPQGHFVMKILCCNCRGMGSSYTISYLREIWHKHRPTFLFLSEIKQCFNFVQNFQFHFGYKYLHTVDPNGRGGGLTLYHSHDSPVTILYSSNRIIDIETSYKEKNIFISFVYGEPVQGLRDYVWECLTQIGITRLEPLFVIGDLNEITGNHEKDGGAIRHASTFLQFNNMIANCGLLEFPSKGNTLSWSGKTQGQTVRCRLDRALGNVE